MDNNSTEAFKCEIREIERRGLNGCKNQKGIVA